MSKNETNGWVCPKCGRVYAPWIDKCQYCGGSTYTYTPPTCPYQWWCGHPYTNTITTDSVTLKTSDFQTTTTTNSTLNNEVKC